MRTTLILLNALFTLVFTITMLWMFYSGNYLASLAACAIATNFEWGLVRGLNNV